MESNLRKLARKLTSVIEAEVDQGLQQTVDAQDPTEMDLKVQFGNKQAAYCQKKGCSKRAMPGSFWCKSHSQKG